MCLDNVRQDWSLYSGSRPKKVIPTLRLSIWGSISVSNAFQLFISVHKLWDLIQETCVYFTK